MLNKFDEITEIGRFASLRHKAPQFPKLALVYARNGYGKTTICAILRSVAENNPDHIRCRQRLDAQSAPSVKSSWTSGQVSLTDMKWAGTVPRIHIFDQEYVQKNLHVGDSVTRENKRSLLPVVLGEEGVRLAQQINSLDDQQRELTKRQQSIATEIKSLHQSIDNVSLFCKVPIPEDLDTKIASATRAVELARQTVAVKEKSKPKRIDLIGAKDFAAVLNRSITSVSSDAAEHVRQHIEQRRLGEHADRWLKYGVDHHDGHCPFCGQDTAGAAIVASLNAYYSSAFEQLSNAISAAANSLSAVLRPGTGHWRVLVETNTKDFEFWNTVAEIPLSPKLSLEEERAVESGLVALDGLIATKMRNPLTVVSLEVDASIQVAFEVIDRYNSEIEQCGRAIENAKETVPFADLRVAERQLAKLVALGARRDDPVKSLASTYVDAETAAVRLAISKTTAQQQLVTYAPQTIAMKQAAINSLLKNFGADFSIVDAKANFIGREPNTDFAIKVGKSKVAAGQKSDKEPSFKTVLSSGDKTTLALAFFLTQVRDDNEIGKAVVVLDDPFNSQDTGRQWETTSQIRALSKAAGQVIVLSHDPRFLSLIEKDASEFQSYQIQCDAKTGHGALYLWSSAEELKELYVRRAEVIREFANHGNLLKDQTALSVQQQLRPFMEDHLRARYPSRFPDPLTMFNDMINAIEEAGNADDMFKNVSEMRSLNEYSRGSMHGGGTAPDETELRSQCRRVMEIVGNF